MTSTDGQECGIELLKLGQRVVSNGEMPSFRILERRAVLLRPSLAAAPFGPPRTQLVSPRVSKMWRRTASVNVPSVATSRTSSVSSAIVARSSPYLVKITAATRTRA